MQKKDLVIFSLLVASILFIASCQDTVGIRSTSGISGGSGSSKCSSYTGAYGEAACIQDKNCGWYNGRCYERLSVPPTPGYVSCDLNSDCLLKEGEYTTINGKIVTLQKVGASGDAAVDVDGVAKIVASGEKSVVNGIVVNNIEQFYDSFDPSLLSATLAFDVDISSTSNCGQYTGSYGQAACSQDKNCEWRNGKCAEKIQITPETTTKFGIEKEVPLGGAFVASVGNLRTNEGVSVQTSLTSSDDDYRDGVALEFEKDSIAYSTFTGINEKFRFLGKDAKILDISSLGNVTLEFDGQIYNVSDGTAFIGESKANPDWIWDIDFNSTFIYLGIKNNFAYNDYKDKPPLVYLGSGGCVSLPFESRNICLDGLTVQNYEMDNYTIEYEPNADLSDEGLTTSEKTVALRTTTGKIQLGNGEGTDRIWVTGKGKIYYLASNNRVKRLGTTGSLRGGIFNQYVGEIGSALDIIVNKYESNITVSFDSSGTQDTLDAVFGLNDEGEVYALGRSASYEEPVEVTYRRKGDSRTYVPLISIGTKDEDHRTAYGIIVRNPKSNGAADRVVLDVPREQVKAKVSMSVLN